MSESNLHASDFKHNGANTNLYCDGDLYFMVGCPACSRSAWLHAFIKGVITSKEIGNGAGGGRDDRHRLLCRLVED